MVARSQAHMRVRAVGDARQGRPRLALAAGAQIEHLALGHGGGLGVGQERRMGLEQAHMGGGGGHALHGAAHQAHPAPAGLGGADHRIHARHVGGEASHGHLALQRGDQGVQLFTHLGFRAGHAVDEHVRRIADHGQHALVAQLADGGGVGDLAQQRVGVDLPVAGVQHRAQRRLDRQAVGLGDRVGKRDQGQLERTQLERAAQRHLGDGGLVQAAALTQLLAQQEGGERRGVDRRLQPRPQPAHGPDMVLVGVGEHDADDVVGIGLDEGRIRQDDLHPRRGLVAEGHAHVDDDPFAVIGRPVAVAVEVHAYLVGPA